MVQLGLATFDLVWLGEVWRFLARLGSVWWGSVWYGTVWQFKVGSRMVGLGEVCCGKVG